jgi:hypothetical protein
VVGVLRVVGVVGGLVVGVLRVVGVVGRLVVGVGRVVRVFGGSCNARNGFLMS